MKPIRYEMKTVSCKRGLNILSTLPGNFDLFLYRWSLQNSPIFSILQRIKSVFDWYQF